jgi:uncharacterized protein (TIGR03437 family)
MGLQKGSLGVGLIARCSLVSFSFFLLSSKIIAAPQLRLSQTAVGPLSVAVGANATGPSVDASNIGDGALNLSLNSSAQWLVPTLGQPRECGLRDQTCTPIEIALRTSALAAGTYTGTITVADAAALDAPQTITVTVQVGGGVPNRIDFILPPNGTSNDSQFYTASPVSANVSTQSGGQWLIVSSEGAGSFRFNYPYRVMATHVQGVPEGPYQGSITTAGSTLGVENKTVPVTLRITSQPIAQLSSERLTFRIAQNGPKITEGLGITNRGLGTFDVSNITAATTSGGNWLTAERIPNQTAALVTANPAGLSPGAYAGTISIANNSVQGALTVPVELTVVPAGPPTIFFGGVVNNGVSDSGDVVAQGAIVSLYGDQLLSADPLTANALTLGNQLGAVRVLINDQPAPIYYASYRQINFQIPYNAAPGNAIVRVERDGQRSNAVSIRIAPTAPKILEFLGRYAIAVNQDGTFPIPTAAGIPSRPARAGDTLVFYAIGLGPTDPAVASGAASPVSPLARSPGTYLVTFGSAGPFGGGSAAAMPMFVGLTPNFVGLYQINVTVPADAPKGDAVAVALEGNAILSNRVLVAIQ